MTPVRHSVESGFGTDENSEFDSHSAQRDFFDSYMPQLEWACQQNEDDDDDDPTLDLKQVTKTLATRAPSPIAPVSRQNDCIRVPKPANTPARANNTFSVSKKRDLVSEELDFIVCQFKKKSPYGQKLADIMLKGLQKTLSAGTFKEFTETGLPENYLPMVRMNNDNTPYVEFLIKYDMADQPPDAQLTDFNMIHIGYSQFILDHLRDRARGVSKTPSIKPSCSTPLAQKKLRVTNIMRGKENLNDSKRVLPSRACKANLSYRM